MNRDQEDSLSAYLDDELEPENRLQVESALAFDPRLGAVLRDVSAVRELVRELVKPVPPVDVSAVVVATIRRRHRAVSWSWRAAAMVSAAAVLVALVRVGPRSPWPLLPGSKVVTIAASDAPRPAVGQENRAAAAVSNPVGHRREGQEEVRSLLENPNLRKILIVTDVVGGDADRQVGDLIEKTPRRSAPYSRFTVSQGIVFDPEHPGEATVFAVVMDDRELGQFRVRLRESFPTGVEEAEPRPDLVTELAAVGQVSVFPGTPAADVTPPTDRLAADTRTMGQVAEAPGVAKRPVQRKDRAASGLAERGGAGVSGRTVPLGRPTRPDPSVVLVWVATTRREGPSR